MKFQSFFQTKTLTQGCGPEPKTGISQTELGRRQGLQTGHTKISFDQTNRLDFEQTLGTLGQTKQILATFGQTEQSLSKALTRLNTLRPDRCSEHWAGGTHPEQDYCPNPLKRT